MYSQTLKIRENLREKIKKEKNPWRYFLENAGSVVCGEYDVPGLAGQHTVHHIGSSPVQKRDKCPKLGNCTIKITS
jgi:hypothetical protein